MTRTLKPKRRETMFGMKMRVSYEGFSVNLRPFRREDLPVLVEHFDSMRIHMYTMGLFAQTQESEEEWYERSRKDPNSCLWAIVPEGQQTAVGTTGLHNIDLWGSAVSGIIIWDTSWWGKGVATRAHLARTLFAADYLQRLTIKSAARISNKASNKALMRVGYNKTGVEPSTFCRGGKYLDTQLYCWLHPERIDVLRPNGLPRRYKKGVQRAQVALAKARSVVSFP